METWLILILGIANVILIHKVIISKRNKDWANELEEHFLSTRNHFIALIQTKLNEQNKKEIKVSISNSNVQVTCGNLPLVELPNKNKQFYIEALVIFSVSNKVSLIIEHDQ